MQPARSMAVLHHRRLGSAERAHDHNAVAGRLLSLFGNVTR